MAQISTVYTYPLDSSRTEFPISFEYLARRFVSITLIGTDRKKLVLTSDYRFISATQIKTTKAWGPGDGYDYIEVKRETSATDRLVTFADGSILRATDLNLGQVQTMHVAEEARNAVTDTIGTDNNGQLDARARRIVNVADAVNPGDAITYRQVLSWNTSALNSANAAAASKSAAAASQSAAKTSETNAKTSETNAKTSQTNAKTSETNAKTSETNSANSASAAKNWATYLAGPVSGGLYSAQYWATQASSSASSATASQAAAKASEDRAIQEANKLANNNAFMESVYAVSTTSKVVSWNDGWKLTAQTIQAGAVGSSTRLVMSEAGLSRAGTVTISASAGIAVFQSTSNPAYLIGTGAEMRASSGMIDLNMQGTAGSQAVRVLQASPIVHLRSSAKMHGYLQAPGNGAFNIAAYNSDGASPAIFSFSYLGNATIGGTYNGAAVSVSGNVKAATFTGNGAGLTGIVNASASAASVLAAVAGSVAGAVGSYAFMRNKVSTNYTLNDTAPGANLQFSSHNSQIATVPQGTWRCMCQGNSGSAAVWLRIA